MFPTLSKDILNITLSYTNLEDLYTCFLTHDRSGTSNIKIPYNLLHHKLTLKQINTLSKFPQIILKSIYIFEPRYTTSKPTTTLSFNPNLKNLCHIKIRGTFTDINALNICSNLRTLDLSDCADLTSLPSFLSKLKILNISNCYSITNLTPLSSSPKLHTLYMNNCNAITDLTPVSSSSSSSLPKLRTLDISRCKKITIVPPLNIQKLITTGYPNCQNVFSSKHLKFLSIFDYDGPFPTTLSNPNPSLQHLTIFNCTQLTDLNFLTFLPHLQILNISSCSNITQLNPISSCTYLHTLSMNACTSIKDLTPISSCIHLISLDTSGIPITNLIPLSPLLKLQTLNVSKTL